MPDRPIVVMMTTMGEEGMTPLREAAEVRMAPSVDPEVVGPLLADAHGLILRTAGRVDAALLDRAPRLKVVGRHGVGFDHIDVAAATERGIQVVSTPGANTESVVEHTLAMMIGLSKHFNQQTRALAEGRYHDRTRYAGRNIRGRSLGIIGFGRIGKRVGEVCHQAFGMSVMYNDIEPMPEEAERRAGAVRGTFEDVIGSSEYVTLHVPLDRTTRHLIDTAAVARMRPDTILINTCRGPVVDERAVAEALDSGRLYGYGADVYEVEPPPADHPLIGRTDNVLLTPHSAAQTGESLANMARWVAEDVVRVLRGERPVNPVNDPEAVARMRGR
jgi:phosphoglycerate dehydrogenase-like enzyme